MIEQIKQWVEENCIADGIDAGIDGPALDVDAFLAYLDKLDDGWISVDASLPEVGVDVVGFVCNPYNKDFRPWPIAPVHHNGRYWCGNGHTNVTHWLPLPSPPKQESSNE